MKVGDLVELSAYGRRLKCNSTARSRVGLVTMIDIHEVASPQDAVMGSWSGLEKQFYHIRRDLKHAK